MMTAEPRRVTGGVDTHADVHVAAVLDSATGRLLGVESFPAETAGYAALPGHGDTQVRGRHRRSGPFARGRLPRRGS